MFDFSHFLTDTYAIVLSAVLLLALVGTALHYGLVHFRIGRWQLKKKAQADGGEAREGLPPVSVVLTAHNDADWLRENLVYLLEQDYPKFEVVVVDYLSGDDTQYVLKLLSDYYPHLKVVTMREDVNLFQGKKYPLSIGIKSASNDLLFLADPDCTPANLQWLRGMVKGYARKETQIVLGFCGVKRGKGLLALLQQYDSLDYSAQYLGAALLGHPYTASGRNLSYRRKFFFDQGAFIRHYDVAEGSDDLFVYQNATRRNTAVCIDADACLATEPKRSYTAWRKERLARVATRNRHRLRHRLREDLPALANLLFYAAAALLVVEGGLPWGMVAIAVALKWAWQMVSFAQLCRRFDGGLAYLAAPLLEIYFIVANTFLILHPLHNNRKFKK